MDEAARCTRVGFMRHGRLIVEGTPQQLLVRLEGRVVELLGEPLLLLRELSRQDPGVENAQMFGDRLHLRVRAGQAQRVIEDLSTAIPAAGGRAFRLRLVPAGLEDVFISFLEEAG